MSATEWLPHREHLTLGNPLRTPQPQGIREQPDPDLWDQELVRGCSALPHRTEPAIVLWRNRETHQVWAEHVATHMCVSETWVRYTRMLHVISGVLLLIEQSPITPWEIDGDKGPPYVGQRVQLHTMNGDWLWVLTGNASCRGWSATWPD